MSNFDVKKKIKSNVWHCQLDKKEFVMKKYDNLAVAKKVKAIHESLADIQFPHTLSEVKLEDKNILIQPWIKNARAFNYQSRLDRTNSLAILHQLHQTGEKIDWSKEEFRLPTYDLRLKWQERLQKFMLHYTQVSVYLGADNCNQLILYAQEALAGFKHLEPLKSEKTLLHGDIVHHNFLKSSNGKNILIDFDLASYGHPEEELIMWMHRVLPNVNYNLNALLREQPSLKRVPETYLQTLRFPNELLREWMYVKNVITERQQAFVEELISFTEVALSSWPKLWYDCGK
ncbi:MULTISPECIES: aminoglycoside phosphotransferase family protein [unclassified Rummeliibacillus]|uniref:aminoglycoside phosphotransferase family protein n=1 Tax=unclassified Rummeliibacillus TaxID=2622809 RepID=UPI000E66D21D|nr:MULTISPECIES: aminoglycoside phosphotransferase family protein [unclassified Rummeliibacillus]RIJ64186.1 aminoglycoside phosphotransferase family protein [Rummeliibacillus sp. POC4]RPJ97372.1 aminoglycoside phosphotransferase family protein [Rummeliibacillus sp. TYF005]